MDIPFYKKFTNVVINVTQDVIYFPKKWFVFVLWFSYQRSFFVCFLSNILIHTSVHANWLYIDGKNDVLKKVKLSKLYIYIYIYIKSYIYKKLATKTLRRLLKVVQSENIWLCFCVPIDNFRPESQITKLLNYLLAWQKFHSIQYCFYEKNIFRIFLSFNFIFLVFSDCSKYAKF